MRFRVFFSITFRRLFLSSCEQSCLFDLTIDCSLRVGFMVNKCMYVPFEDDEAIKRVGQVSRQRERQDNSKKKMDR